MLKQVSLVLYLSLALAHPKPDSLPIAQKQAPTVSTPLGSILGSTLTSRLGRQIFAFRGIRYAQAPVNDLRFQPPVAVEKWEGIFNATQEGPMCPQTGPDIISEDCLLLSVYTTRLPKGSDNPKRPVIVYFYSLGFDGIAGDSLGPKYFLDQDIVLVIPNYRLGVLGFLSTGEKEAPGNNGLKDQALALKWVKENIAGFGGDPDSVTIAGYSGGGISVTLHLVSPISQGLFHKAIISSGSMYGNWPVKSNQTELALKQAKAVGCNDEATSNVIKCLKTKSIQELANSVSKIKEFWDNDPIFNWLPVIEPDFGQERFLPAHPLETILSEKFAQVPIIIGLTTDEFSGSAVDLVHDGSALQVLNDEFETHAPIAFMYERNTEHSKTISKELRNYYFGDKPIDNSSLSALAQIYSDALVGFAVNRAARLLTERSDEPLYYYRFNYKGRFSNYYLKNTNNTVPYGVVHRDDLIYLFDTISNAPDFRDNDPESQTVEKLTEMWANFAKTGNPIPEQKDELDNVKWDTFNTKTKKYLDIGNKLVMSENLFEKRYTEWHKLFPMSKYYISKSKKHSG